MKPVLTFLLVLGAVALLVSVPSPAFAQGCGTPTVSGQFLDAYYTGLPEAYLSGRVFVFGNPSINSGTAQFLCRAFGDTAAGGPCPQLSGSSDDGNVMIYGDWFTQGVTGCPVTPGQSRDGDSPNVAFLTSIMNEGTTAHAGVYVLSSVGYSGTNNAFFFDLAQPFSGSAFLPVAGNLIPSPRVSSFTNNGDGTATANLAWDHHRRLRPEYAWHLHRLPERQAAGARRVRRLLDDGTVLGPAADQPGRRLGYPGRDLPGRRDLRFGPGHL